MGGVLVWCWDRIDQGGGVVLAKSPVGGIIVGFTPATRDGGGRAREERRNYVPDGEANKEGGDRAIGPREGKRPSPNFRFVR